MTTTVTVLRSGQNTTVGSVSSRTEYSVSVSTGVQGVSVTAANVASGNLVLTLSNNSTIDAGSVAATVNTTVNTSAQYTWSNTHGFTANVTIKGIIANSSLGSNGQVLTSNGTSTYWANGSGGISSADLTANLANYQTTAGLSANVATLTSNNTSFVGTVSAANVVSNSQLTSNLANYATTSSLSSYQTTAGLSANVATLTSNNASYLGGVAANQYAYANATVDRLTSNSYTVVLGDSGTLTTTGNTAIVTPNNNVNTTITFTTNFNAPTANPAVNNERQEWKFDHTGITYIPGSIISSDRMSITGTTGVELDFDNANTGTSGSIYVQENGSEAEARVLVSSNSSSHAWEFHSNGAFLLPTGGTINSEGDDVAIVSGKVGAVSGNVTITTADANTNTRTWEFGRDGKLTLPSNTVNNSVFTATSFEVANGTFNLNYVYVNPHSNPSANVHFAYTFDTGGITVPVYYNFSTSNSFIEGAPDLLRIYGSSGNVAIWSNELIWSFENDGTLTLPSTNGAIVFSDATVQTTAFTGSANNASYLGGVAANQYAYANQVSVGSVNVAAQFAWTNSHTFSNSVTFSGSAVVPSSNTLGTALGSATQRWVLIANTGTFSGAVSGITTLAAGNTTITGFANVTSTLQVTGNATFSNTVGITGTLTTANPILSNIKHGYTTTATAGGTTTLTATSNYMQFFTGSTTQVLSLPAPQTMTLGQGFLIVNNSTGNIEVRAANAATVITVLPGTVALCTSIDLTAGNGAAGWNAEFVGFSSATGTGSVVLSASPTFTGTIAANNITLTGNVTGNTAGFAIGYRDVPQNFTNTSVTLALTDAGKHILTQNSGSSTQTITIPPNGTVAFQTGTAITIVVQSTGTVAVANGAGVTMYLAGNSSAKSTVTLNSYSMATLLKIGTDTWMVSGTGAT